MASDISSTAELTAHTQEMNSKLAAITDRLNELHPDRVKPETVFSCFDKLEYWPSTKQFCEVTEQGENLGFKAGKMAQWVKENHPFKTDIDTGILYFFNGKS